MATILLLEKDPIEAWRLQCELMLDGNHRVIISDDIRTALRQVFEEKCELVIADWTTLDGSWLCKELRKLRPGHGIPFIAVGFQQALADPYAIEHILRRQCGCDDYIAKPFDPHLVAQLVDVLLLRKKIKADMAGALLDDAGE